MDIGIIGTGTIGGLLARAFARANAQNQVWIYNRTPAKALQVCSFAAEIRACDSPQEVANKAPWIFLCTKAVDGKEVFRTLAGLLSPSHTLLCTISGIDLDVWAKSTAATVTKVIPSLTQAALAGVLLLELPKGISAPRQAAVFSLLDQIATPVLVEAAELRVTSDLTSCGPAFLSSLLLVWAETVAHTQAMSQTHAEQLLTQTFIGTARLLELGFTLQDILAQIKVPGGVTDAGVQVLTQSSGALFAAMHQATAEHARAHATSLTTVSAPAPTTRLHDSCITLPVKQPTGPPSDQTW